MSNYLAQNAFRAISDAIAAKQFNELRQNKAYFDKLILNTPSGKEKQKFQVGQTVIAGEKSLFYKIFVIN